MKARKGNTTRRAGRLGSVLERLEDRSLLSAMAASTSPRIEPPEELQTSVEVGSVTPITVKGRFINVETQANQSASASGPGNSANVNFQDPPSANASDQKSSVGSSASSQVAAATSDPVDPGQESTTPSTAPSAPATGFTGAWVEDNASTVSAGLDRPESVILVGWTTISTPSWGGLSSPGLAGPVNSLLGRMADTPALSSSPEVVPELANDQIPLLEYRGLTGNDARATPNLLAISSAPNPRRVADTPDVTHVPLLARLMESAVNLDGQALDRDMRQFLSRITDLGAAPDVRVGREAWPFWLAVLTTAFVAIRATGREGWWLRRLTLRATLGEPAPSRCPGHPGPWPLGLP
jgi:hypothetical protein